MPYTIGGVDVAYPQPNVDWVKVAAAGKRFAFIKATQGANPARPGRPAHPNTFRDPQWRKNVANIPASNIPCGAYHFLTQYESGGAQAAGFLAALREVNFAGILAPIVDVERLYEKEPIDVAAFVTILREWISAVKAALNATPTIYTGFYFWQELGNPRDWADSLLWLAGYVSERNLKVPPPWTAWTFWQHTGSGRCDGIASNTDLDWFHGNEAAWRDFLDSRTTRPNS